MNLSAPEQSPSPSRSFLEVINAFKENGHDDDAEDAIRLGMIGAALQGVDPLDIFKMTSGNELNGIPSIFLARRLAVALATGI